MALPEGLPDFPREREYPQTVAGGFDYARDMASWVTSYVDATDRHRKVGVETWVKQFGEMVAQHEADLQPMSSARPGWVANANKDTRQALERFIDQVAKDNVALMKDNDKTRGYLKWAIITSASALISLAAFLAGQLIVGH